MLFLPLGNQRVGAEEEFAVVLRHALSDVQSLMVDIRILDLHVVSVEGIPNSDAGRINDDHLTCASTVRWGTTGVLGLCTCPTA